LSPSFLERSGRLGGSWTTCVEFEEQVQPIRDRVLIRQDRRPMRRRTGILLPSEDWPCLQGWVVATSPDVDSVGIGDYVIYEIYAGPEFEVAGERYTVVSEKDLVAVVTGAGEAGDRD